ncbi:hypothetical protein CAEBREN_04647 [Caenorhabditis brenneri]|uniref:Peptidase C1A papain C-terminal domain-containing protein n=1 Tax=Caenorhabditis brenneri TaxID=135651 RepID=G0MT32_CAEBE|nr:hypothetical protein CAEBREN_04647 [Caenorhabditis brenneri]
MTGPKLFFQKDSEKTGKKSLLDEDLKIREEFLLDTSYPPRQERCFKKLMPLIYWLAFIIVIAFSICISFTVIYHQLYPSHKIRHWREFEKFREEFKNADFGYRFGNDLPFREKHFEENFEFIEECRRKNPGVNFSVNQFADWGEEKMRRIFLSDDHLRINNYYKIDDAKDDEQILDVPDSFDWRSSKSPMVTPVKNQGDCGSCWAFAVVAAIETQFALKKGALLSLSEQELVDCDVLSYGCNGGYLNTALLFAIEKGLETEADYPYVAIQQKQCSIQTQKIRVKIDDGYHLKANEDQIADWVAREGPVSFLMPVPKSIMFYRGGIFNPSMAECRAQAVGNHVMAIVGFGREGNQKFWIVKNSWGTRWGEQGYLKMARGVNICGFTNYVFAPHIN